MQSFRLVCVGVAFVLIAGCGGSRETAEPTATPGTEITQPIGSATSTSTSTAAPLVIIGQAVSSDDRGDIEFFATR